MNGGKFYSNKINPKSKYKIARMQLIYLLNKIHNELFFFREYLAEVRVRERETANREMARNTELQYERRQAVAAMEQMIESQQRIERIQRSLAYLRDLHSRMVSFKF